MIIKSFMRKLYRKLAQWCKKNPVKALGTIVLLCVVYAIFVHIMYQWSWTPLTTQWSSGDALNFGASMFTLAGTLFLGYMAYRQGEKANQMNERLTKTEQRRDVLNRLPLLRYESHGLMNYNPSGGKKQKPVKEKPSQYSLSSYSYTTNGQLLFDTRFCNDNGTEITVHQAELTATYMRLEGKIQVSTSIEYEYQAINENIVANEQFTCKIIVDDYKIQGWRKDGYVLAITYSNVFGEQYRKRLHFYCPNPDDNKLSVTFQTYEYFDKNDFNYTIV